MADGRELSFSADFRRKRLMATFYLVTISHFWQVAGLTVWRRVRLDQESA